MHEAARRRCVRPVCIARLRSAVLVSSFVIISVRLRPPLRQQTERNPRGPPPYDNALRHRVHAIARPRAQRICTFPQPHRITAPMLPSSACVRVPRLPAAATSDAQQLRVLLQQAQPGALGELASEEPAGARLVGARCRVALAPAAQVLPLQRPPQLAAALQVQHQLSRHFLDHIQLGVRATGWPPSKTIRRAKLVKSYKTSKAC
jgi:hypothetical protein